jgi:uncharacterized lipoprotein YddW (UPF0748 family)
VSKIAPFTLRQDKPGRFPRRRFLEGLIAAAVAGGIAACAPATTPAPPTATPVPLASPGTALPASTPTPATAATIAATTPTAVANPTTAASTVVAGPSQLRAFWVDAFKPGFKSPAEVDRLLDDVRRANANAVIVQMRRRGDAYFNRRIEPRTEDPALTPGFDVLDDLLTKARSGPSPLQVHAWVASFPIWRNEPPPKDPTHVYNQHGPSATGRANWLSWGDDGKQFDGGNYALDPGHPDAADYTVRVVGDIARQYDVDGIHLDYIRYAQTRWGYNPVNVERFNQRHGLTGKPSPDDPRWADWRRAQVSAVVRRLYLELQKIRPSVQLSGALIPWGHGPADEAAWLTSPPYAWTFQDWHSWLAEGIVDLGFPMVYFREGDPRYLGAFDEWTRDALAHQGRRRVAMGPGIFDNTIADSIGQIERAFEKGATGIALYSYATFSDDPQVLRSSLIDALTAGDGRPGPFATPARPPILPWKTSRPEAHLYGRALDPTGKPLDGATVTLRGPETRTLTADGSGYFGAIALAPGDYQVALNLPGAPAPTTVAIQPGKLAEVQLHSA